MRGAPLAVALAYLGPLPIMIATLGWGCDAGLVALFAACGVAAAATPGYAIVYGAADRRSGLGDRRFRRRAGVLPSRKVAKAEEPPVPRPIPVPAPIALLAAALFIARRRRPTVADAGSPRAATKARWRTLAGEIRGRARRQRRRRARCPRT